MSRREVELPVPAGVETAAARRIGSPAVVEMEVPFYDVDALGIVWHGNYFKYLDVCRTQLMRMHQLDLGGTPASGHRMLVIESKCRHVYPLRYGDRFSVTAWFTEVQNRVRVAYVIWSLTHDRRAAKAHTILVTTDADGTMLWTTPEIIRRRIAG